ncbi:MAG TPA: hypothetical protein VF897_19560 [Roseiflexaceae bacterium]
MRRAIRLAVVFLLGTSLLCAVALAARPALFPTWLYYDLVVRQVAPLPPEVEQLVLDRGEDFCSVGRDSACGGYKIANGRRMTIDQAQQNRAVSAAWCVDYVVLRRNAGQVTGGLIYWAKIPRAMVVYQASDGTYDAFPTESCKTATLQ